MISYIVESKDYEKIDLPSLFVSTLKANDAFKNKFIVSCECQLLKADEKMKVTYVDNGNVVEAEVTMKEAKA